jgi:SAM-dependent MidA family methyltransferase
VSATGPTPIDLKVAELVRRHGPLPFSTVMDLALYDADHGFYASGGSAGRRGDFITSPEVGPLFGAVVARALDTWWDELGRPAPYVVVEGGAGVGTLALAVLAAAPRCAPALRYVMVERSAGLQARHGEHLALAEAATALGIDGAHDGPVVVSLSDLPAGPHTGVVIANELLDNLAFDLVVRTADGWGEVRVGADDSGGLHRHVVPAGERLATAVLTVAPDVEVGTVLPVQAEAAAWVGDALEMVERGRVVVVDYAVRGTAELADRPADGWLRSFRGHERVGDPLVELGTADITADVCLDQIEHGAGSATSIMAQAEWLRSHGIDELVEEGRQGWAEGAGVGDLAALKARSRVREADALLDPDGLGGFLVAEWVV